MRAAMPWRRRAMRGDSLRGKRVNSPLMRNGRKGRGKFSSSWEKKENAHYRLYEKKRGRVQIDCKKYRKEKGGGDKLGKSNLLRSLGGPTWIAVRREGGKRRKAIEGESLRLPEKGTKENLALYADSDSKERERERDFPEQRKGEKKEKEGGEAATFSLVVLQAEKGGKAPLD